MKKEKIKVAIVEDRQDIINFLVDTINDSPNLACSRYYKNGEEALVFLPKSTADIVIVDIGLPGDIDGIECVRQIKALRPDIEFVMYTVLAHDDKIFESLKAGASGYLLKSDQEEKIIAAIQEILEGGAPMSPAIARKVRDFFFNGTNPTVEELDLLSPRELEVLDMLSRGLRYKDIAQKLNIVEGTVKAHINKIYKKLHVQNRTQAINVYLGR